MEIEEKLLLSEYLNLYGKLLTEKQRDVMRLYFDCDVSLGEIAETTGTTRQAVADIVKRSEKQLKQYEQALHFAAFKKNLIFRLKRAKDEKDVTDVIDYVEEEYGGI